MEIVVPTMLITHVSPLTTLKLAGILDGSTILEDHSIGQAHLTKDPQA